MSVETGTDVHLLASDLLKDRLGENFGQLAERQGMSILVVSANDIFPDAKRLLGDQENPERSTVLAAVTDTYRTFPNQFSDVAPDIVDSVRGGLFGDEFRHDMMVDSLYQREPVGKVFITDSGTPYGVIVLPPLNTPKEQLAGYELNIGTEHFQNLPGNSADWMNWVIDHEGTHAGKRHLNTGDDVAVLSNEIEADNGTYDNAVTQEAEGNPVPMQVVETVARLRSLNAVLTPVDNNHATGPAIGPEFRDESSEAIIAATQAVRLKVHSAIATKDNISLEEASRVAIDTPDRVVTEMRELTDIGAFEGNGIQERLVGLSLEAVEHHLTPGYTLAFNSSDIDAFIERKGINRDTHLYGQDNPDPKAVYEAILTGDDTDITIAAADDAPHIATPQVPADDGSSPHA